MHDEAENISPLRKIFKSSAQRKPVQYSNQLPPPSLLFSGIGLFCVSFPKSLPRILTIDCMGHRIISIHEQPKQIIRAKTGARLHKAIQPSVLHHVGWACCLGNTSRLCITEMKKPGTKPGFFGLTEVFNHA
ncbi:hypothetical protein G6L63_21830 [Agrobacterium vitis]|uniref:hypothetical protein n=1 Tax=Agrobacterium vitis TaxID=373 RepID=UPI000A8BD846|nr:hypothetical protein [Agrobacterium vitis]MCF1477146.1 hypothetical protein [Agrobacterium vitis]MUZ95669.1 hypothetical protein [Agrobacterium vitis]MVA30774.1 hypothetical protein [Agrobacterium vitis]NOJ33456.1 hypothetical protein [Agrobacterium vitis]NSZ50562.1 hypothetical protein [Agrobacterium vitis]